MVLTNKEETKIIIECNCGCESLSIDSFDNGNGTKDYFISMSVNAFYSEQEGFFSKFIKRVKTAWYILTKGTYYLYEICLNEKDMQELKDIIIKI